MKIQLHNIRLIKILLLALTLFLVISCSSVKEGIIIEKWYEEPISTMGIISTGKIMMPTYVFDDEDFVVKIEGLNKNGVVKTQKYYISKVAYDTVIIGNWFCVTSDCDTRDYK